MELKRSVAVSMMDVVVSLSGSKNLLHLLVALTIFWFLQCSVSLFLLVVMLLILQPLALRRKTSIPLSLVGKP